MGRYDVRMPKPVDVEERRRAIADAVFELVDERGVEGASLRNVAERSGLNIGSVRHYVDGASGMLALAARVMSERVEARLRAIASRASERGMDGEQVALDLFEEFLPLDERRRHEVTVWLAFTELARVEPDFAAEAKNLLEGPREVSALVLQRAGVADVRLGAELMAASIDGLTLALLHDPGRISQVEVRELLRAQLGLCMALRSEGGDAE